MPITTKLKITFFNATLITASTLSVGIIPTPFCVREAQAQDDIVLDPSTLPMEGNNKAIVTIIEFFNFSAYNYRVIPTINKLLEDYPSDIRVAYAPCFVRQPQELLSAKAAYAAHLQGKFKEMRDFLFDSYDAINEDIILEKAQALKLDIHKFIRDMHGSETDKFISNIYNIANKYNIYGTPTFLVNGTYITKATELTKTVEREIRRAKDIAITERLSGLSLYKKLVKTAPDPKFKSTVPDLSKIDLDTRYFIKTGDSPVKGPNDAIITFVGLIDYSNINSKEINQKVKELIDQNPGLIRFVHKHYPEDIYSETMFAHQASIAADNQGKFWEMNDILLNNQNKFDRESLIRYAKELDLDMDKFIKDMDSQRTINRIKDDINLIKTSVIAQNTKLLSNGKPIVASLPINTIYKWYISKEIETSKLQAHKGLKGDALYKEIVKISNMNLPNAPKATP